MSTWETHSCGCAHTPSPEGIPLIDLARAIIAGSGVARGQTGYDTVRRPEGADDGPLSVGSPPSIGDEEAWAIEIEQTRATVFVEVADTLVADFDLIEFLHSVATHATDITGAVLPG